VSTDIQRKPLTDAIIAALTTVQVDGYDLLVGNQLIPIGSGWKGEPNKPGSQFIPYVVLTTLTAARSDGSFAQPQKDWMMPYSVQSFGVMPEQAQWMSDETRGVLHALRLTILDLGDANYKIDYVNSDTLGGINRIDVANTPFYGIQDGVSLSLRKQRS
jgi:hypothetical protein